MIACVDEKSLFHLISTQGPLFVSMDSCHLFLRNQRSLNINFSSPNTKRKHSLRKSPKIQLRTRADTGGKLYNVPGIPRAPERLELTRKKNDNKVNNHDTKEATINEKYRWGAGGEIICHLQRSEQCSRQSFPSVEHIQGGLPVAAVQQGNNFVIRVEDSLQMNQYLSTDPVWGLSPRLAATLDGDMAAKRMSVLAVALKSGQGAVRFARYSHNLTEATAATAATAAVFIAGCSGEQNRYDGAESRRKSAHVMRVQRGGEVRGKMRRKGWIGTGSSGEIGQRWRERSPLSWTCGGNDAVDLGFI